MRVLGVDPGIRGGLALIGSGLPRVEILRGFDGLTLKDLGEALFTAAGQADLVILEKVTASPPQRGSLRFSGGKSMFTFGQSFGRLEMALCLAGTVLEYVVPQRWQREFMLVGHGRTESQTQKKNRHKEVAQRLFPDVRITHGVADALLLAEYGLRKFSTEFDADSRR